MEPCPLVGLHLLPDRLKFLWILAAMGPGVAPVEPAGGRSLPRVAVIEQGEDLG